MSKNFNRIFGENCDKLTETAPLHFPRSFKSTMDPQNKQCHQVVANLSTTKQTRCSFVLIKCKFLVSLMLYTSGGCCTPVAVALSEK